MDNYGTPKFPYIWKEIKKLINENVTQLKKIIGNESAELKTLIDNESAELRTLIDNESAELRTLIDGKVSASTSTGSGTKANMASSTNLSNLAELTLPDEGVYILVGLARFPSNSNGRRGLTWGLSSTGYYDHSLIVVPPVNGAFTRIQSVALCTATSKNYKVYLNAYHTAGSGTKLDVDYYWRYIKLA